MRDILGDSSPIFLILGGFLAGFDQKTLEHLEKLCRIDCSKDEEADILSSLNRILTYIELLNEIDTKGVLPCNYVLRGLLKNQLRQDVIQESLSREKFLDNSPEQIGGMIKTPPILN